MIRSPAALLRQSSWSERVLFIVFFSFIIVRQSLWSLVNPMFQAPDETAHLLMVAQIDKHGLGFYKEQDTTVWKDFESSVYFHEDYYNQKGVEAQAGRLPLYTPGSRWAEQEKERLHVTGFDKDEGTDTYRHAIYTYPPLYYYTVARLLSLLRLLNPTLITYQFATRLLGIGFYLAFILIIAVLGFELFTGPIRYFFVAMVAFHPMLTFIASACNNDNPLLPLSALLFYGVARVLQRGLDGKLYVLLLITSVLLSLTKAQGFLLSIIVLSSLTLVSFWQKDWKAGGCLGTGLLGCSIVYLALLALIGDFRLNGTPHPMGLVEFINFVWAGPRWLLMAGTLGMFAWYEVRFDPLVYCIFSYVCLAVAIFAIALIVKCLRRGFSNWQEKTVVLLFSVYITYIFAGLTYQFVKMTEVGFFIQGRYFLSAFPIVYIVAVYLLRWLFGMGQGEVNRAGLLLALIAVSCLICLNNWGLYLIIRRFYVTPGIGLFEVVNRIMQYKPAFFKSDLVFYGLVTYYFVGQVYLVLFLLKAALRGVGLPHRSAS